MGGGVRTYLAAKRRHLAHRPDVTHVAVLTGPRTRADGGPGRVHFIRGPRVPFSPGYHLLTRARRVREIIRRERPDVVEIGSPFLAPWIGVPAARAIGARLVGFFHSDLHTVWTEEGTRSAGRLLRAYLQAVYRRFDLCIATTPSAAAALRRVGARRVEVVPLGVETDTFRPERRSEALRARLGVAPETPLLLYAGRLSREKGLDLVLTALPDIHAATGGHCVAVGAGHLRTRLERWARAHPNLLTVLPYEADRGRLATVYASADLFLAPCPYETFGLAALEALASGVPVIGANAGGLRDLLAGNPHCRLFDPNDPTDLARRTIEILTHGRASWHGARCTLLPDPSYDWARTFDRLVELYRSLPSGDSIRAPASSTPSRVVSSTPAT